MRLFPLIVFLTLAHALNGESTISPNKPYAYSGNTGWISLNPGSEYGVRVEGTYLPGYAYAANFGWVHVGNGAPENGVSYSNATDTDFGVNRDPQGNLTGLAYSGNVGWINFSWTDLNDPNRPRINHKTGEILGYAYSANVGWILLGTNQLFTFLPSPGDEDGDFIDDDWELIHFNGTGIASIGTDSDGDGQSDASEAIAGTLPTDPRSYFRVMRMEVDIDQKQVSITFSSSPGIQYSIQQSESLRGAWTDNEAGVFTTEANSARTVTVPFSTETIPFFRVSVVNPKADSTSKCKRANQKVS